MSLFQTSHLFRALASPVRLRILALLAREELCVCQLTTILGVAPSTVSAHVAKLHRERLLTRRKEGRWVSYRLAEAGDDLLGSVLEDIRHDEQVEEDVATLDRVLRLDRALVAGAPEIQKLVRIGAPLDEIRASVRSAERAGASAPG